MGDIQGKQRSFGCLFRFGITNHPRRTSPISVESASSSVSLRKTNHQQCSRQTFYRSICFQFWNQRTSSSVRLISFSHRSHAAYHTDSRDSSGSIRFEVTSSGKTNSRESTIIGQSSSRCFSIVSKRKCSTKMFVNCSNHSGWNRSEIWTRFLLCHRNQSVCRPWVKTEDSFDWEKERRIFRSSKLKRVFWKSSLEAKNPRLLLLDSILWYLINLYLSSIWSKIVELWSTRLICVKCFEIFSPLMNWPIGISRRRSKRSIEHWNVTFKPWRTTRKNINDCVKWFRHRRIGSFLFLLRQAKDFSLVR